MTFALLLVLAGALATDARHSPEAAVETRAMPGAATTSLSGEAFKVAPLVFGSPYRRPAFQPFRLAQADPNTSLISTGVVQLQNRRTGVTCTMRILELKPSPDLGIFSPASGPHPDPIVRSSLSPCVE
jgi:hypothetical protein